MGAARPANLSLLSPICVTYGGLESCGHEAPCGPPGAGEEGEGGDQQAEHGVADHDDRVGRHAGRPRVPAHHTDCEQLMPILIE